MQHRDWTDCLSLKILSPRQDREEVNWVQRTISTPGTINKIHSTWLQITYEKTGSRFQARFAVWEEQKDRTHHQCVPLLPCAAPCCQCTPFARLWRQAAALNCALLGLIACWKYWENSLNPNAEIKNRHLIEPFILTEHQLLKNLHSHLLLAVSFIPNRLIYSPKIGTSPYEALFNKGPDASRCCSPACWCWYLKPKELKHNYMEEGRSESCYYCLYSQSIHLICKIKHNFITMYHCRRHFI